MFQLYMIFFNIYCFIIESINNVKFAFILFFFL